MSGFSRCLIALETATTVGVCRRRKDKGEVVVVVLGVRRGFFFLQERVFGMCISMYFIYFCSGRGGKKIVAGGGERGVWYDMR